MNEKSEKSYFFLQKVNVFSKDFEKVTFFQKIIKQKEVEK